MQYGSQNKPSRALILDMEEEEDQLSRSAGPRDERLTSVPPSRLAAVRTEDAGICKCSSLRTRHE